MSDNRWTVAAMIWVVLLACGLPWFPNDPVRILWLLAGLVIFVIHPMEAK